MGPQDSSTENGWNNSNNTNILYYYNTNAIGFDCNVKLNNTCPPKNHVKVPQGACGDWINSIIFRRNLKSCKFQLDCYSSDNAVTNTLL